MDTSKPLAIQTSQTLNVREDTVQGKFVIDGLSSFAVASENELYSMLNVATANRITKAQLVNESSSRSHAILQLTLEIEEANESGGLFARRSVLTMVDLAGSERVRKSGSLTKGRLLKSGSYSKAEQLKEAQAINKSITALGICIQTMAEACDKGTKPAHIPYRDSKLTRLLAEALGGSTRKPVLFCLMIVACIHSRYAQAHVLLPPLALVSSITMNPCLRSCLPADRRQFAEQSNGSRQFH